MLIGVTPLQETSMWLQIFLRSSDSHILESQSWRCRLAAVTPATRLDSAREHLCNWTRKSDHIPPPSKWKTGEKGKIFQKNGSSKCLNSLSACFLSTPTHKQKQKPRKYPESKPSRMFHLLPRDGRLVFNVMSQPGPWATGWQCQMGIEGNVWKAVASKHGYGWYGS